MLNISRRRSSIVSLVALLTSSVITPTNADVVAVKESELTMNIELQKDIQQTLGYLRYQHYLPVEIDDEYSSRMLDGYLKILDPNKIYFTQADIDSFNTYRYKLDDLLKKRDGEVAFEIFKVFRKRIEQSTNTIMQLIKSDFDFTIDESINIDRDSFTWAKNDAELRDTLRKRIKNDTLLQFCLLYTSPSPRDLSTSRMPSSA